MTNCRDILHKTQQNWHSTTIYSDNPTLGCKIFAIKSLSIFEVIWLVWLNLTSKLFYLNKAVLYGILAIKTIRNNVKSNKIIFFSLENIYSIISHKLLPGNMLKMNCCSNNQTILVFGILDYVHFR